MRRAPSIRAWLIGLGLVTLLPSVLLSAGVVWWQWHIGRQQVEDSTRATARLFANTLDQRFQQVRVALQTLAVSPELQRGELSSFHHQARQLVSTLDLTERILLLDGGGRVLLDTALSFGTRLPTKPPNPQIMASFVRSEPILTDVESSDVPGPQSNVIFQAVPVSGSTPYVIAAAIDLNELQKALLAAQFSPNWTVAIFDRNGRFAARSPRQDMVGMRAASALVIGSREAREGALEAVTRDGIPVLGVFSRAPESGYTFSIGIPHGELLAPLKKTLAWSAAAAVLLLAAVVGVASFFARRIGNAIRGLTKAARRIGRGYKPTPQRWPFREANELQLALNLAATELDVHNEDFERMTQDLHRRDITELAAMLHATRSPVVLTNDELKVEALNSLACELFGISMEDGTSKTLHELLKFPEDATGKRARTPVPALAIDGDGHSLPVAMQLSPIEHGATKHWVAVIGNLRTPEPD